MSDIAVTTTNVLKGASADVDYTHVYGETVTAGQAVYLKSTESKWWKMQCDGTAEEAGYGVPTGVALNGGAAGQPAGVQRVGGAACASGAALSVP